MAIGLSGFGDEGANGTYIQNGTHDGQPYYEKDTGDYILIYKIENGPYSFTPAYYIEKVTDLWGSRDGAIPITSPKYVAFSTNLSTATWIALTDNTSNEQGTGTIDLSVSSSSTTESSDSSTSESSSLSEGLTSSSS